jgi:hypothetical protein
MLKVHFEHSGKRHIERSSEMSNVCERNDSFDQFSGTSNVRVEHESLNYLGLKINFFKVFIGFSSF